MILSLSLFLLLKGASIVAQLKGSLGEFLEEQVGNSKSS